MISGVLEMKRLKYVEKCMQAGLSDQEFVVCVFEAARKEAEKRNDKKDMVFRATKAMVEISAVRGIGRSVSGQELVDLTEGSKSPTDGLWPWLEDNADVVERDRTAREFLVRPKYYKAMLTLFSLGESDDDKRSILELMGLGKELWKGIDPKECVEHERSNWGG